jgi:hypothetical protein
MFGDMYKSCTQKRVYASDASSSYVANGTEIQLSYGGGSCSGYVSQDTLLFGGLVLPQVHFVETVSFPFSDDYWFNNGFDGLLGLSFGIANITQRSDQMVLPVFDQMMQLGLLNSNIFSFYLSTVQTADKAAGNGALFMLGGVDPKYYVGPITWIPLYQPGLWQVQMTDVLIGGKSLGWCSGSEARC